MAHFAELDENNIVLRVIVIGNEDTADEDGNEVTLIVHGFELLLPFLCVQFLEIMEYEGRI